MQLVTLDSAKEALQHIEQHNGPGRLREAHAMLKKVSPLGWVAKNPAEVEPLEEFTRVKARAEQYLADGWLVTEVFSC